MAIVRQYQSPVDRLTPDQTPIERFQQAGYRIVSNYRMAGSDIGRGIAKAGKAIGDNVDNYLTQQDISRASSHGAALHASLLNQWNTVARSDTFNPNNQQAAQNFLSQTVEPELEKYQQGFNTERGRVFALEQADSIRNELYHTVAADVSTMAGDAVIKNVNDLSNSVQTMLYHNPEQLGAQLGSIDRTVNALVANSPGISPTEAEKIKTTVGFQMKERATQSAFTGLADRNPQAALDLLNSGKYGNYINGAQAHRYIRMAIETQKQEEILSRQASMLAQRQAQNSAMVGLLNNVKTDANGHVVITPGTLKAVWADPNLSPAQKMTTYRYMVSMQKAGSAPVGDSATFSHFAGEAMTGNLDMSQVIDATTRGEITPREATQLHTWNSDVNSSPQRKSAWSAFKVTASGFKQYISRTNLLMGKMDPRGEQRYADFLREKQAQFQAGIEQGWAPESMLKEGGAHYIFGDISNYEINTGIPGVNTSAMTPAARAMLVGPQPLTTAPGATGPAGIPMPNPGETPEAFAKRLAAWQAANPGTR